MPFCIPKCCVCLAHSVPRAADRSSVRSHTKDTHKSTLGRRVSTWDCWCTKYACHKDKLPSPVPSPSRPSTQRMKQREENDGVCIVGEHAKLANHACTISNIACDQHRVVPRPTKGVQERTGRGVIAHKRHAQEHRVENWSHSAAPARAAGADQTTARRRWHGWLQKVRHLLLPLLGSISCCAGPPGCWLLLIHKCARPTGIIS